MNRHLNKLCLACNITRTGANWARHVGTKKHLKIVEALGGINPGFKFVRDLDQESVPMKKAKDRKLDRHLVKSNRNEQGDFQCPT